MQIPEQTKPLVNGDVLTQEQKDALPRILRVRKLSRKGLPDVFGWGGGGQWIIRSKLKYNTESLKPILQDFIPIQIKSYNDQRDYNTYFHQIYNVKLDPFVNERNEFDEGSGREAAKNSRFSVPSSFKKPITLRKDVVQSHHLWRGALEYSMAQTYCSDDLAKFIKSEKLSGIDMFEVAVETTVSPESASRTRHLTQVPGLKEECL